MYNVNTSSLKAEQTVRQPGGYWAPANGIPQFKHLPMILSRYLYFAYFTRLFISVLSNTDCSQVKLPIRWPEMIGQIYSSTRSRIGFPLGFSVKNLHATQETQIWSLICQDPTRSQSNYAMGHNCWACARAQKPQPESKRVRLLKPALLKPAPGADRGHLSEQLMHHTTGVMPVTDWESPTQQQNPSTAINK